MRITSDLLHKLARQTVNQRLRSEPDLLAAYLSGSLLGEQPLLGGSTDIDLVLVHKYQIPVEREVIPLTPQISLDITHKIKDDYEPHRSLRHNPWMGYPLTKNHILLFDTDHWLEFIQAGVSANFHRPDNVLARVKGQLNKSRELWFSLMAEPPSDHLIWLDIYLLSLAQAAQSMAGLIGDPLTTRRFLSAFRERLGELSAPEELLTEFLSLLGASGGMKDQMKNWIDSFEGDFDRLAQYDPIPVHLHECRRAYYLYAMRYLANDAHPEDSLWPLLRIWLDIHIVLQSHRENQDEWEDVLNSLELSKSKADDRLADLDRFIDQTEIFIESWEALYG
jgi:hypothetical protein